MVENIGLGEEDRVDVRGNPLNRTSIETHILALQNRGVTVSFDNVIAELVNIPDDNLRAKIEDALGKAPGAPITTADMERLTRLDAQNANITDLTGLEGVSNLTYLDLGFVEAEGRRINSNSVSKSLAFGRFNATDISESLGQQYLGHLTFRRIN